MTTRSRPMSHPRSGRVRHRHRPFRFYETKPHHRRRCATVISFLKKTSSPQKDQGQPTVPLSPTPNAAARNIEPTTPHRAFKASNLYSPRTDD
jgi:hypothetical protein